MRISEEKKEKISEQILSLLYSLFPQPLFTNKISQELARDEEFIKKILMNLEKKKLIKKIILSEKGEKYKRKQRWTLTNKVYEFYKNRT